MTLYTAEDVARALRVSVVYARHLLSSGKIQGRKVGKHWIVHEAALREYVRPAPAPHGENNERGAA